MNRKSVILFTVLLFTVFIGCERTNLPLDEPNLIIRLDSFLGENVNALGRQLKSEGFYEMELMDIATTYNKKDEQYTLYHKTSGKLVNSAAYLQPKLNINDMQVKYDEWKKLISENGVAGKKYLAQITAPDFNDFDKNYIDSIAASDTTWSYIYDDEIYFSLAYAGYKNTATYVSETWYEDKKNTGKEMSIQMTVVPKRPDSNIFGNVGIMNSDYTIK